jgi:addiction module HigA family antidote
VPMKNPPHPGRIVRQDCIEPLKLTITETAKVLGVTRQALNNLVNGKAGISAEMAVRLSKAFGGSPEVWLRLQTNYDLAQLRQDRIDVKRYPRAS